MNLQLTPIRQRLATDHIENIHAELLARLRNSPLSERVKPGMRIAVAVGSRGISCITPVVETVVRELQHLGAEPFLVPAMGSHGGGTAEGQRTVLEGYGLGPDRLGIPIYSSLETVQIGSTPAGMPIYWDTHAADADGVIIINRIKEHTAFKGNWESGICKMMTVGLGKARGAAEIHKWGLKDGIPAAARVVLAQMPILAGIAIVENGHHQPARIEVLPPDQILETEAALLRLARQYMPKIPFDPIDLLIVQEMGKDISGTGMDLNVIGMWRRNGGPVEPDIRTIVALDLTPNSHGNAIGVGFADLIPQRLRDKIDLAATYKNSLTARNFGAGKIPITLPSDRAAIEEVLSGLDLASARVVLIRNTLELEYLWVSEALLELVHSSGQLEIIGPPQPLTFDAAGNLVAPRVKGR